MTHILALTDEQTSRLIELGFAIVAMLTPVCTALVGYLVYKQRKNRETVLGKIEENTQISRDAFDVANGHNEKIASLTKLISENREQPVQKVEVVGTEQHPVHTIQDK